MSQVCLSRPKMAPWISCWCIAHIERRLPLISYCPNAKQRTGCVSSPPHKRMKCAKKRSLYFLFSPPSQKAILSLCRVAPWRRKSSGQVRVKTVNRKQSGVIYLVLSQAALHLMPSISLGRVLHLWIMSSRRSHSVNRRHLRSFQLNLRSFLLHSAAPHLILFLPRQHLELLHSLLHYLSISTQKKRRPLHSCT